METKELYVKIELTEEGFVITSSIMEEALPFILRGVADELEESEGEYITEADNVGELQ